MLRPMSSKHMLICKQRFLMWIQGPLSLISGFGVFFSIPKTFTGGDEGEGSISAKLARIDYLGAFTLVCSFSYVDVNS